MIPSSRGLSIVIPAYNREGCIGKCLRSILDLEARPLEVLVIDDGSEDRTVEICTSLSSDFRDLGISHQIFKQDHAGAQVARNLGLENCRQSHVLFLDSDDYIDPAGLDRLLNSLDRQDVDLAIGLVDNVNAFGRKLGTIGREWRPGDAGNVLNYDWHTGGVVYCTSFVRQIGGWALPLTGSQDWEIQVRAKVHARRVWFEDSRIAFWVAHDGERVGALQFRFDYTESVLIACGMNLNTLVSNDFASTRNQLRLAAKVALHLDEMKKNGVDVEEVWQRIQTHFGRQPFMFRLGRKLPWRWIDALRSLVRK